MEQQTGEPDLDDTEPSRHASDAPLEQYWEHVKAHVRSVLGLPVSPEIHELRALADRYLDEAADAIKRAREARAEEETGLPPIVQRSIAFINANLQHPVSAADIAEASGASLRAVQGAFKISLGTTPLQYLLDARVAAAREQLLSDPSTTIAVLAHRWGFSNASRFSSRYRETFGEYPSETRSRRQLTRSRLT